MEVAAVLTRPLMNVLMLLVQVRLNYAQGSAAAFARIVPTSLQVFEYRSLSVNCEGINTTTGWRVMRKIKGKVNACVSNWETTAASVCAIRPVYPTDSGEYWCETGDGDRSNSVNITVAAGAVILESPVLPVMEGDPVTLRCINKTTYTAHRTHFYKNGLPISKSSTGQMIIGSVSTSDEGLYKCNISDIGESPESWLAVEALRAETPETHPSSDQRCHTYLILRTVFTIFMVALLLLLVGLLHCGKLRVTQK